MEGAVPAKGGAGKPSLDHPQDSDAASGKLKPAKNGNGQTHVLAENVAPAPAR